MIKSNEVNKKNKYVGALTKRTKNKKQQYAYCREALLKGDPKAITLIALVITIVVLIILAGVAINLTLGENGILKRAEAAKLKYQIAQAKEELDLKIAELQTEKQGTATLNDLVDILKNETDMDYIVSLTQIASITGVDAIGDAKEIYIVYKIYQFRVDEKLNTEFISIVENYAPDITITSNIKSYEGKNADGKYIAKVEVKVESKELVQSIELETANGMITEVPTQLPYTKEIEVEIGSKYLTKVTAQDGKVKKYVVEEKAEETIKNAQELATFRDKVNSGLTYEGKTVSLAQDIDLSSVCGEDTESWEPIGTETNPFKGTFDGNNTEISSIYINTNNNYQGLFGFIDGAILKNIIVRGNINGNTYSAGIVAYTNNYSTIKNCINYANINSKDIYAGGITSVCSYLKLESCENYGNITSKHGSGGIVGVIGNNSIVEKSCNRGTISADNIAGGITAWCGGYDGEIMQILNCYNRGNVYGGTNSGGISGYVDRSGNEIITNCYTTGQITGGEKYAISGRTDAWEGTIYVNLSNNYWLSGCGASSGSYSNGNTNAVPLSTTEMQNLTSTLGDAYVADGKIKNSNGELIDNVDDKGNIIYINNGYPILKWQIGE